MKYLGKYLCSILILAFALFGAYGFLRMSYPAGKSLTAAIYSGVIVDLTNRDRLNNNDSNLKPNDLLSAAAQAKANDMASKGYFAHTSPEGITPWYWFKQVGYKYVYAGENLAINFDESLDVENAWMNSPTHRANILNNHYTDIGVAMAQGIYQGRVATFVVQEFGSTSTTSTLASNAKLTQGASAYDAFLSFEIFLDTYLFHSETLVK
jgi:hypothetical protein